MAALLSAQRSQKMLLQNFTGLELFNPLNKPDLRDTKLKYNLQHIPRTLIYAWELKPLEGKILLIYQLFQTTKSCEQFHDSM